MFELPVHATNMDIMSRIGNIFRKEPIEYILDKFSIDIEIPCNGYFNLRII